MTESVAKGFVQGKLDCMNKYGIFNKEDNINNVECDNCEYCYSQGNFGKQKEAFSIAINALEKQKKIKEVCSNTMIDTYLAQDYDKQTYNKAIDDFLEKVELKYLGVHPDELLERYYPYDICKEIKKIAEQLKEKLQK